MCAHMYQGNRNDIDPEIDVQKNRDNAIRMIDHIDTYNCQNKLVCTCIDWSYIFRFVCILIADQ